MAATKYQVLYRYLNDVTNAPITNNSDVEYNEVCEFFQHDHKIMSDNDDLKAEAEEEKNNILIEGNSPVNSKSNMLFAYAGTKKIKHVKFVSATKDESRTSTGHAYVIRDYSQLDRKDIGDRGDFTKKYTTLYAPTIEDGGTVVTNPSKYVPKAEEVGDGSTLVDLGITSKDGDVSDNISLGSNGNKIYKSFTSSYLMSLIVNSTIWQLTDTDPINYCYNPIKSEYLDGGFVTTSAGVNKLTKTYTEYYDASENFGVDVQPSEIGAGLVKTSVKNSGKNLVTETASYNYAGYNDSENVFSAVKIKMSQIARVEIPEHYEESSTYPYLIKDTYVRINQDPWFVNCNCGSLEKAIEKAKALADVIGLNNVKVVKLVAIDNFIKLK